MSVNGAVSAATGTQVAIETNLATAAGGKAGGSSTRGEDDFLSLLKEVLSGRKSAGTGGQAGKLVTPQAPLATAGLPNGPPTAALPKSGGAEEPPQDKDEVQVNQKVQVSTPLIVLPGAGSSPDPKGGGETTTTVTAVGDVADASNGALSPAQDHEAMPVTAPQQTQADSSGAPPPGQIIMGEELAAGFPNGLSKAPDGSGAPPKSGNAQVPSAGGSLVSALQLTAFGSHALDGDSPGSHGFGSDTLDAGEMRGTGNTPSGNAPQGGKPLQATGGVNHSSDGGEYLPSDRTGAGGPALQGRLQFSEQLQGQTDLSGHPITTKGVDVMLLRSMNGSGSMDNPGQKAPRSFGSALSQTVAGQVAGLQTAEQVTVFGSHALLQGGQASSRDPASFLALLEQVADRGVREALRLSPKQDLVEVSLDPPSLGRLLVRVSLDDGQLKVHLNVTQPETKGILDQHLPALKEILAREGLQISGMSVALGDHHPHPWPSQGEGGRNPQLPAGEAGCAKDLQSRYEARWKEPSPGRGDAYRLWHINLLA